MPATRYHLRCTECGATYEDDGVRLDCDGVHGPALLRSVYPAAFVPTEELSLARYRAWLPLARPMVTDARGVVYRSRALAGALGVPELWIAFNGWWPERGATLQTATFKELEAYAVLGRLHPGERRTLVVASAGNTGAAFVRAATDQSVSALVVIPLDAWPRIASLASPGPTVEVVAVADGSYDDAIALARFIADDPGFFAEGGVRNVARRDGMGTVMLAAAEAIGRLPDRYVQAVGSGAGAIAVHEAAARLIAGGRYGTVTPRLHLAQNAPYSPLHDAWSAGRATLLERSPETARAQLAGLGANVLSNQSPPYATRGGVREALAESRGVTDAVTNEEMLDAMVGFAELEGVDIEPAAGVAAAALARGVRNGTIDRAETVLLHVTGGGAARRAEAIAGTPSLIVPRERIGDANAVAAARALRAAAR